MKYILFFLIFATSLSAQKIAYAENLWLIPMEGGQCMFVLDSQSIFAPIFNPKKVASVWFRIDEGETISITLNGRDGIVFEPDTIMVSESVWVRQLAANYDFFPLKYPGDPLRSQYIAPKNTVKELVCGCFERVKRIIEVDSVPVFPVRAVERYVIRA